MGVLIRSEHLRRYKDIVKILLKHGLFGLVREMGLETLIDRQHPPEVRAVQKGEELARDLEDMGPTFVKLGQLLSTRPDILPVEYTAALERLQSEVAGFPFEQVREIVESELGTPLDKAFSHFEGQPLAAASIGQVHRAVLRDGPTVAVKVQRPGIFEQVMADLEVLEEVADFVQKNTEVGELYQVKDIFREFKGNLLQELDYLQEKRNILELRAALEHFDRILVPAVISSHTTSRVLTMEFVEGVKITSISPDMRSTIDTPGLLGQLVHAYLKQVLLDGFFHADPHPGNLALTPDGRIALLDLGMVARVTPEVRDRLIRFMLAVAEGQSEEAAEIAAYMGDKMDNYDPRRYRRRAVELISRYHRATLAQIHPGVLLTEFTEISRECGIRVPRELAMLGKTLMHLDQATNMLDPEFDPAEYVRKASAELLIKHIARDISPGNVMRFVLAIKDIAQQIPRTASFVLDQIANNELRLKVEAFDETRLVRSIQKLANRVTLGLLLGSLIVGAALLSYVPTSFTVMGYPGVAIIFFLIAASGALGIIWDIVVNDERANRNRKKHR